MTALREAARAKLNLTLEVLGHRADGYHELRSLVAFAAFGDELELVAGSDLSLAVEGPFADALVRESCNLVIAAAEAVKRESPRLKLGTFRLTKNLPVAAGLGGGSADAAATLRLLGLANRGALDVELLRRIAAELGSDVTVCLESKPALMTGRGEIVAAVEGLPTCGVVLANPGVALAARDVYAALKAPSLAEAARPSTPPSFAGIFEGLIDYARSRDNDLQSSALRLAPSIASVLAALNELTGARLARLSGSGATCFALFATENEARQAASALQVSHPDWWIAASRL
jgi:4-diphosphocytidyl-2-C-methyl-D-erythritol kinase